MKHIKPFKQKYKTGDHVVAYKNTFVGILYDYLRTEPTQIIDVVSDYSNNKHKPYQTKCYCTYDLPENINYYNSTLGFEEEELRPATPEEIEKYNLKKIAGKYNL